MDSKSEVSSTPTIDFSEVGIVAKGSDAYFCTLYSTEFSHVVERAMDWAEKTGYGKKSFEDVSVRDIVRSSDSTILLDSDNPSGIPSLTLVSEKYGIKGAVPLHDDERSQLTAAVEKYHNIVKDRPIVSVSGVTDEMTIFFDKSLNVTLDFDDENMKEIFDRCYPIVEDSSYEVEKDNPMLGVAAVTDGDNVRVVLVTKNIDYPSYCDVKDIPLTHDEVQSIKGGIEKALGKSLEDYIRDETIPSTNIFITNLTDDVKIIAESLDAAGFSVKSNGDGTYNVYDNQDKEVYAEGLVTASEVLDSVSHFVSENVCYHLAKELADEGFMRTAPHNGNEWRHFVQHADERPLDREFVKNHADVITTAVLLDNKERVDRTVSLSELAEIMKDMSDKGSPNTPE